MQMLLEQTTHSPQYLACDKQNYQICSKSQFNALVTSIKAKSEYSMKWNREDNSKNTSN